jgi:hypothetical protein
MTPDPHDDWSSGRLIPVEAVSAGPFVTDCASWDSDVPAEKWSTGQFVSVCQALPAAEGEFTPAVTVHLKITLRLAPPADPGRVHELATRLIETAHQAAPQLRLAYDPQRSGFRDHEVFIVLAPKNAAGAETVLSAITDVVCQALAESQGVALTGFELKAA